MNSSSRVLNFLRYCQKRSGGRSANFDSSRLVTLRTSAQRWWGFSCSVHSSSMSSSSKLAISDTWSMGPQVTHSAFGASRFHLVTQSSDLTTARSSKKFTAMIWRQGRPWGPLNMHEQRIFPGSWVWPVRAGIHIEATTAAWLCCSLQYRCRHAAPRPRSQLFQIVRAAPLLPA